ncbi:N-acetylmuramoyl-L-alanine amidase [Geothermobacter hydrogeniphilus]|uniref:N-acetylmuramoyl-L-alanine amidase n=1 Tax=Geothermobacter hydrogeniphilus TaxID=1969733 RepID=A0A2K2HD74_9BACT|nr:N-acetylmuramoyl-L-alanine amidase [Geothermobacter hydrogeniphilus]PNU21203.1 N-acetylmuramoyl-L-alanine amidase [Geothermobacter hydrogeniphilus]
MVALRAKLSVLLALVVLLGFAAPASALDAESAYQKAKQGYIRLQQSAKKQLYRDNWMRVVDDFVGIAQAWPEDDRAADALYMAGKACRGLSRVSLLASDARRAVGYFDRVADNYPASSLADDSLLLAGELLEDPLADFSAAYRHYARIVRDYPRSDMFARARPRAKRLAAFAPAETPPVRARSAGGNKAELAAIRSWSGSNKTRIVLDFNRKVDFRSHFLAAGSGKIPARIYLDLKGADSRRGLEKVWNYRTGLVSQIRTGHPRDGTLRVALDLTKAVGYHIFSLADPYRIVVDLSPGKGKQPVAGGPELHAPPPADGISDVLANAPAERKLKVHIPSQQKDGSLRLIVVDAGHGGKDPGAIGPGGTREKDVALAIAREVARQLRKTLKCKVVLTRDRDVFLPLDRRTEIANQLNADLFISIHANASRNRKAYGIETYYLNFSKSDAAVAVAARENDTSLKEVGDLELILFDLMANSKINESSRLATEIQSSLVGALGRNYKYVKDLGVRPGPFYVLLGATMPSVLVETAFISNRREEKRLKDRRYHQKTAIAIARGVRDYARALKLIATR